ncbi:hypothetical protein FACS189451_00980 [Bacteroidia bacterium]|nr:hypothetical protein FACS189446_2860 [Bacteroidia bacterium]GHT60611.1 hypothetical protein FACS189451_00980 [Bacteroidia bacterium]
MREKMKKMLFLMLFLLIFGAASVNSQVRIGGNGVPNGAAVLDLNATDATNTGTKGLALPRVSLASNTAQITSGTANLNGMLVYNTGGSLSIGVYYWNGTNWLKVTNSPVGTTDIADGAVTSAKIAADAIDSTKIKDGSISFQDLEPALVGDGEIALMYADGRWGPSLIRSFLVKTTDINYVDTMSVGSVMFVEYDLPDIPSGYSYRYCWPNPVLTPDFEWRSWHLNTIYVKREVELWPKYGMHVNTCCFFW